MATGDDAYIQSLERRITAYLEMHPVLLVTALNVHYNHKAAFNQSIFFDRKALVEAIYRSPLDTSAIFRGDIEFGSLSWGRISWNSGPFRLVNVDGPYTTIIPTEEE